MYVNKIKDNLLLKHSNIRKLQNIQNMIFNIYLANMYCDIKIPKEN